LLEQGLQERVQKFCRRVQEFAERSDENFRSIMVKYGEISNKLTSILETLVRQSRETREMLNETMKLIREVVEKLSR